MAAGALTEVEQRPPGAPAPERGSPAPGGAGNVDAPAGVPRRATGVELIGRFEDSGFKEPPYLARRPDGQIVQLAPVLYALAEEVDGERDTAQIAEALSHRIQRGVDAAMVEMLLDEQLRRLGLVAQRDGVTAEVDKVDPLLALKFRTRVVPAGFVRAVTTVFRPLFWPPLQFALSIAFAGCVVWLFGLHGISQGLRHLLYQPALLFLLVGGVIVATAFHELGHATAVRYGGAEPGVMGVGIYIVWPAFYTDITDAYRLGKWGRLRADTGGMYFNALFGLAATGAYLATGFEPLLLLVVLQTFAIVQQSLPFLRLDGYYIVSDLTGVPDMLSRIRPVLASLLPWREPDPRVTELKPWVRVVVTAYVLTIVPLIALMFMLMLVHAPRAFATAWDSLGVRWERVGHEGTGATAKDAFQMAMLTLPCLGMLYTTSRVGHRTWRGAWRWSAASTMRRAPLLIGAGTAAACLVFLWWPHGDYRPIAPGERGTLIGGVRSLGHVTSGQAAVLPQDRVAKHSRRGRERGGDHERSSREDSGAGVSTDGTSTTPAPASGTATTTSPSSPPNDLGPRDSIFGGSAPSTSSTSTSPAPSSSSTPAPTQTTTTETTPAQTTTTETTPTQTTTTETTPTQTTTTETTPTQTTTTETTPTTTTESSPQP
jgi:putative peptide zinc metalloprotease protein